MNLSNEEVTQLCSILHVMDHNARAMLILHYTAMTGKHIADETLEKVRALSELEF